MMTKIMDFEYKLINRQVGFITHIRHIENKASELNNYDAGIQLMQSHNFS